MANSPEQIELMPEQDLKTLNDISSDYILISSDSERNKLLKAIEEAQCFAFDTETTSLDTLTAKLHGVAFSTEKIRLGTCPMMNKPIPS